MVTSNSSSAYGFIGLTYTSGEYIWSDYSPYDYKNWGELLLPFLIGQPSLGLEMPALGTCAFVATTNDIIPRGQWMNADCNYGTVAVCKKSSFRL